VRRSVCNLTPFHFSTYVDATEDGISPGSFLQDLTPEALEAVEEDSERDENLEILEIEKRDFDDVEGIDSDVEK
jgi:hypothetical protein